MTKNKLFQKLRGLSKDQNGATAIEYGLIAALIAVVIIAGVTLIGTDVGNSFNNVANNLSN
jgi:pilus assembly protein Flp/PilA